MLSGCSGPPQFTRCLVVAASSGRGHRLIHSVSAAAIANNTRLAFSLAIPALAHTTTRAPAIPSTSVAVAASASPGPASAALLSTSSAAPLPALATSGSNSGPPPGLSAATSSLVARPAPTATTTTATATATSASGSTASPPTTTQSRGLMTSTTGNGTRSTSTSSTAATAANAALISTTAAAAAPTNAAQAFTLNAEVKHDLFGKGSQYAAFRPTYPPELFSEIFLFFQKHSKSSGPTVAIDVGSGTGQATIPLSKLFDRVVGVEGSKSQRENAQKASNVEYVDGTAEKLPFADSTIDFIAVAQAAHWFDLDTFYREAHRTLKSGGTLAIWSYAMAELDHKAANDVLQHFHFKVMGPYWDAKRRLVDDKYRDIQISETFVSKHRLTHYIRKELSLRDLLNYVGTWSSMKTYAEKEAGKPDPRIQLEKDLAAALGVSDISNVRINLSHEVTLLLAVKP